MKTPSSSPELEQLTQDFERWRTTKTSFTEQPPETLCQRAVKLLTTHKPSHIIKALRLNSRKLQQWQNLYEEQPRYHLTSYL